MRDHLLGFPAALNCIPLEPRKAHVTPPRTSCSTGDAFASEDWTHVGMHTVQQSINGAASGGSASPERWAAEGSEAAPPSTTDKPQGVWVKASERSPEEPGLYMGHGRLVRGDYGGHPLRWDGKRWFNNSGANVTGHVAEWLDTTPSKQEDDGWIDWDCASPMPTPIDVKEAKLANGFVIPAHHITDWGRCVGFEDFRIIAYRIVKEQA